MNENENNFEPLRRLLALKRHEIPPPGYFENFSREVTARIRAGETGGTAEVSKPLPWLFRLLSTFEAKPAFVGAFASALCMLLLFGIVYAERPDMQTAQVAGSLPAITTGSPLAYVTPNSFGPLPAEQPAVIPLNSTNPVFGAPSAGSWLVTQSSQEATFQKIPFILPGN